MKARGTLTALLPVALVVLLGLLSACGDDSASSAADPADTPSVTDTPSEPVTDEPTPTDVTSGPTEPPNWPACETLWVEGGKIPLRYHGCLEGEDAVAADNLSCSSGQRLVRYQERFFGAAGGTIYLAMGTLEKDKQYLEMVRTCRA
jgi:hypothetical protein